MARLQAALLKIEGKCSLPFSEMFW